MRKYIAFLLICVLILTGCASGAAAPAAGDFSFDLPAGYSTANVTDRSCSIVWDEDGVHVGGIELTTLTSNDVTGKNSDNVMNYLMDTFHMTKNIEYIATHWGSNQKILIVDLEKHTEDGDEELYGHYFFEKNQQIYHLWLDRSIVDPDAESQFLPVTGVD